MYAARARRVRVARPGRLEPLAGDGVEGQDPLFHQLHQLVRDGRVQRVAPNQQGEDRAVGHGHGQDHVVPLGQGRVPRDRVGQAGRVQGVAYGDGQGPFYGFGGVGVSGGFAPGQPLLHAPAPRLADGLAGVPARPVGRFAVEQREQLLVHPAAEIGLVVAAPVHQGPCGQFQDESRLGQLSRLHAVVVTARHGVGVAVDPLAVVAVHRFKVVVPMRAETKGVADERAHQGSRRAVLCRFVRHGFRSDFDGYVGIVEVATSRVKTGRRC
jgi:hypothetical protein